MELRITRQYRIARPLSGVSQKHLVLQLQEYDAVANICRPAYEVQQSCNHQFMTDSNGEKLARFRSKRCSQSPHEDVIDLLPAKSNGNLEWRIVRKSRAYSFILDISGQEVAKLVWTNKTPEMSLPAATSAFERGTFLFGSYRTDRCLSESDAAPWICLLTLRGNARIKAIPVACSTRDRIVLYSMPFQSRAVTPAQCISCIIASMLWMICRNVGPASTKSQTAHARSSSSTKENDIAHKHNSDSHNHRRKSSNASNFRSSSKNLRGCLGVAYFLQCLNFGK